MPSLIDPSKPAAGHATTDSVRKNFQFAKQDIEYMQNQVSALIDRVEELENQVSLLIANQGGDVGDLVVNGKATFNGVVEMKSTALLNVTPIGDMEAAPKSYVDHAIATNVTGTLQYAFNTNTTPPPTTNAGAGQVRLNATQQTATEIYVRYDTDNQTDSQIYWNLINAGDVIIIQDHDDSNKVQAYNVTGPGVDDGNNVYMSVPVTWRQGKNDLTAQTVLVSIR